MENFVTQVYELFDSRRKQYDALMADEEDIKILDDVENKVKNRDK
jgi:hypothetical protein